MVVIVAMAAAVAVWLPAERSAEAPHDGYRPVATTSAQAEAAGPADVLRRAPAHLPTRSGEVSLSRQTRTVVARTGGSHRVDVPAGVDRLVVGVANASLDGARARLVVRREEGRAADVVASFGIEPPSGRPAWRDVVVDVDRPGTLSLDLETVRGVPDAMLSRPSLLRVAGAGAHANVLLVSVDTLRADYLGVYGYDRHPTSPQLDALARRGTVFEKAIAPSSWTVPSHMALLTGVDPDRLGMDRPIHRTPPLARGTRTLAALFGEAGYLSVAFTGTSTMSARNGLSEGFHLYEESSFDPLSPREVVRDAEQNFAAAEAWLRSHRDVPFFMLLHTFDVHKPYTHTRFVEASSQGMDRRNQAYASGVAYVDERLGRLFEVLRELALFDRTLIVVLSDHGEGLGARRGERKSERAHGHTLYDEVLHVPLILHGPGIEPGLRVAEAVPTQDVFATLVDLFDLPGAIPETSRSLRPLLEGRTRDELPVYLCCLAGRRRAHGLRTPAAKYLLHAPRADRADPIEQLFDLAADPFEVRNVSADRPDRARALGARLRRRAEANRRAAERITGSEATPAYLEQLRVLGYLE